jgi:hypothetical protein
MNEYLESFLEIVRAHRSREQRISGAEIAQRMGLSGTQQVRQMLVGPARDLGYPICSQEGRDGGYWWGNYAERIATAERLETRAGVELRRARKLRDFGAE